MHVLNTDRLLIQPFTTEDASVVQQLLNNIDLARTTLHIPHPCPDGLALSWIISSHEKMKRGSYYSFAIILKGTMEIVGSVSLNIALNHKRGELSYWIGRPYWDQGFATEAARKVIEFAFETLQLNRIWAVVMSKNLPSIEVMRKSELQYEGTFKEHILKWGVFEDVNYYGLTISKYRQLKDEQPEKVMQLNGK